MLSRCISSEKFGFMENRQIHDVVGVAQEVFHCIKKCGKHVMVLKLELVKAYDRVDCGFLRLILLQVGLDLALTNWIMVYA